MTARLALEALSQITTTMQRCSATRDLTTFRAPTPGWSKQLIALEGTGNRIWATLACSVRSRMKSPLYVLVAIRDYARRLRDWIVSIVAHVGGIGRSASVSSAVRKWAESVVTGLHSLARRCKKAAETFNDVNAIWMREETPDRLGRLHPEGSPMSLYHAICTMLDGIALYSRWEGPSGRMHALFQTADYLFGRGAVPFHPHKVWRPFAGEGMHDERLRTWVAYVMLSCGGGSRVTDASGAVLRLPCEVIQCVILPFVGALEGPAGVPVNIIRSNPANCTRSFYGIARPPMPRIVRACLYGTPKDEIGKICNAYIKSRQI